MVCALGKGSGRVGRGRREPRAPSRPSGPRAREGLRLERHCTVEEGRGPGVRTSRDISRTQGAHAKAHRCPFCTADSEAGRECCARCQESWN
eukprot:2302605-Rhodomonas_salina.1